MKVLYILQSSVIHGGAHKSFMSMVTELIPLGVSPIVVLPDNRGLSKELRNKGIRTFIIPFKTGRYPTFSTVKSKILFIPRLLQMLILNSLAVKSLRQFVRNNDIDIIHSNSTVINIGFLVSSKTDIPHVWHIREYGDSDFKIHYFPSSKVLHNRLRCEKSFSISITEDVCRHHGLLNNSNSVVIYNPIDYPIVDVKTNNKKHVFLYVGSLSENKGTADVIKAFANFIELYPENDYVLKIIGKGSSKYVEYCKRLVDEYNLSKKVFFMGVVDNVRPFYQEAIAFIMPSYSEGFGRVTAEAMLSGTLVIGRDTAGTKEQFDKGLSLTGNEIGLRFNVINELSSLMLKVAKSDLTTFLPLVENGQRVAYELYSSIKHAQNVMNFYKKIINK